VPSGGPGPRFLAWHGERDAYCSPALAQAVYDRKRGDKGIRWLDARQHTELCDNPGYVRQAVAAAAAFFHRWLNHDPQLPGEPAAA
jgi:fermentation-respiration switch protein FrsA (DUF1100 family)